MNKIGKLLLPGMLFMLAGAGAVLAQNDMCIPGVGGLAGLPTMDGIVENYNGGGPIVYDPGWNGATRWNLSGDHGATTSLKFQSGVGGGSLYLSFVVGTPFSGPDDTIVLGFSTDGNPAHDWRIHVKPFDASVTNGSSLPPQTISYWRDSNTWNTGSGVEIPVGTGHWLFSNTSISRVVNSWAVEMRIPILAAPDGGVDNGGIYIPSSGTFRFYANVLNTTGVLPAVVQSPWPAGVDVAPVNGILLTHNTPAVTSWGTASLNSRPACDGVSLSWADVGVEDPLNPSNIVQVIRSFLGVTESAESQCAGTNNVNPVGNNNVFIARPFNEMGSPAKVSTTFRIANWGIPATNAFDPIGAPAPFPGVTGNPTVEQIIPPLTKIDETANWKLTYKQSCQFKFHSHNCIQVVLDSTDPATRFKNKSVEKNMDFVPASAFSRTATISGDVRGARKDEKVHRMLIAVDTDQQDGKDAKPPTNTPKDCKPRRFRDGDLANLMAPYTKSNLYSWIARGYVATGNKLQIGKNVYEIVDRAGDFGYVAIHNGPLESWSSTFRGDGMKPMNKEGLFFLEVPTGKTMEVETTITGTETPCLDKNKRPCVKGNLY